MRKAQLGVLSALLCGSVALGGCNLAENAGDQARDAAGQAVNDARDAAGQAVDDARDAAGQAGDAAGNVLNKGRACAEALGLTRLVPDGKDLDQFRAEIGERAQRLDELGRKASDTNVQDALFRAADFYVEAEQRRANTLGELNDWMQRNVDRVSDLRTICL